MLFKDLAYYPTGHKEFSLEDHLHRQREFSLTTFGPGARTETIFAHIRKELIEIETNPTDVSEWIDVVILALDGALRAGHEPDEIVKALIEKQRVNELRSWPDWKSVPNGEVMEHIEIP